MGKEAVVLDLKESRYLGLNLTGAHIWELLSAGSDETTIADELVKRFPDVDRSQLEVNVRTFLDRASSLELIQTFDPNQ